MTEEEFLKKVRKDTRIYKRTVSFLKKLPSPFAKILSWVLLRISNPAVQWLRRRGDISYPRSDAIIILPTGRR